MFHVELLVKQVISVKNKLYSAAPVKASKPMAMTLDDRHTGSRPQVIGCGYAYGQGSFLAELDEGRLQYEKTCLSENCILHTENHGDSAKVL
jgi:hypothetical protein